MSAVLTDREFHSLYLQFRGALHRCALAYTHDVADADDLLQEASLRMAQKYHLFRRGTNFRAWAQTIIHNTFRSAYRRSQRRRRLTALAERTTSWAFATDATHGNGGPDRLGRAELAAAVAALSPCMRETFELRYLGYSYPEIADELGVAVGTVKSRMFHVRVYLKRALGVG